MGEQEKNVETDKQLKRIQDEIIASIEGIYQSIENIGKVNKEIAQMLITRVEAFRQDINNNTMSSIEMLSELMSIQRDIMGIMNTDYYTQTAMYFQPKKKNGIEVHDQNKLPAVSQNLKKGFWHKLSEKITKKLQRKNRTEFPSILENTPTINAIAENIGDRYSLVEEDGFVEDFRYPVYEQLKKIENNELGLDDEEVIPLNDERNCISYYGGSHLFIWIDVRRVKLPFETGRHIEIDGNVIDLPTFETGIEESELGKVLKFAKFLGGTKER